MGETAYDRFLESDRGPALTSGVVVERHCPNLRYRRVHAETIAMDARAFFTSFAFAIFSGGLELAAKKDEK